MQRREVEILNRQGLNAPASTKLTQLAAKYQCEVSLARSGRRVNAKSLMGVMMLAAAKGAASCWKPTDPMRRKRLTRSSQ